MKKTKIDDVCGAWLVEFDRFDDDRGYFEELFSTARDYPHLTGIQRQINLSKSAKDVVRGLHVVPFAKLCTCVHGSLYDVVVDVRPGSPTFLKWYGVWLHEHTRNQLFIPAGCAHGFYSNEDDTILVYMQDGTYDPGIETIINWRDPTIDVKWPPALTYHLSEKDRNAPFWQKS